ncbi:soma ferritin-like isoform X1 [Octopus sinensis]|uniref:Ferritin n=1 Tax=Octopus sinensis TaxID=2607531 RepID=A0A7E6FJW9_9MOLL|nr:soma ferritin-like isoform X1 [Octopus sinensis]
MAESRPRQNFSKCCEEGINKQINLELYASYVYQSMAYYFDRDDVALKGFFEFFKKRSEEEKEHAEKFMKYQNKRGGRIILKPIEKPAHDAWGGGLRAVEISLDLEKDVNAALLKLHKIAEESGDPQVHLLFLFLLLLVLLWPCWSTVQHSMFSLVTYVKYQYIRIVRPPGKMLSGISSVFMFRVQILPRPTLSFILSELVK